VFRQTFVECSSGGRCKAAALATGLGQCCVLALVVALPVFVSPVALTTPQMRVATILLAPMPLRAAAAASATPRISSPVSAAPQLESPVWQNEPRELAAELVDAPPEVPRFDVTEVMLAQSPAKEEPVIAIQEAPPCLDGAAGGLWTSGDFSGHAVAMILTSADKLPPPPQELTPELASRLVERRVLSGGATKAVLVKVKEPEYPRAALEKGVTGKVKLMGIVDAKGRVQDLRAVSGPPVLAAAAEKAVGNWRYRPATLSGKPVAVAATFEVNFRVARQ
jgi:TonB family protein